MSIQDWPNSERPREKLIEKGASSLSDVELLALFIQTGRPGFSAVYVARELLVECKRLITRNFTDEPNES